MGVFQETAQSPKFGKHREVGLGSYALAEYSFADKSGKRESAYDKLVDNTGIFRLGKPKAN